VRLACGKEVPHASRLRAGGPAVRLACGKRSRMRLACGKEVPHASRLREGGPAVRHACGKEVPHASRLREGGPIGVSPLGKSIGAGGTHAPLPKAQAGRTRHFRRRRRDARATSEGAGGTHAPLPKAQAGRTRHFRRRRRDARATFVTANKPWQSVCRHPAYRASNDCQWPPPVYPASPCSRQARCLP